MVEKLVLGTANFGMVYGIANQKRLGKDQVFEILDLAYKEGIRVLDTARAYGQAEDLIGEYTSERGITFRIITKLPQGEYKDHQHVRHTLLESLRSLRTDRVDYLLLHSYQTFKRHRELLSESLEKLREEELIGSYGISVYHPQEVLDFMEVFREGFAVEFPLNLFDQRFLPYIPSWRLKNIELFARSVFLQGLFFLPEERLTGVFQEVRDRIKRLRRLAFEAGMELSCFCLRFVSEQGVDRVVVGVDNTEHLRELLGCLREKKPLNFDWEEFRVENEDIILPYRWR